MSMAYIAGKTAFLPMDPYEAEQFLYDLGLDGPGAEHSFDIIDDVRGFPIDWGTDFRVMNRLFQRIIDLGDMRGALKAWCSAQHAKACWEKCSPGAFLTDRCTAADALKASYHMRSIGFYPGVCDDRTLGGYVLENYLSEDYNALPDDAYALLDRAEAGARFREQEGGQFVDGGYLVVHEDFSGEPLPAEEPLAYFQVRFSDERHDSGWCDVPLAEADERLITRVFGCTDLSALPMECRSIIPQLNGIVSGADELPELRLLDEALNGMNDEDIQKYKVLLEVVQPGTPSAALRLAGDMPHYDVELDFADPAAYGQQCVADILDVNEHDPLLPFIDYAGFGAAMLYEDGYLATRYGAVYMNVMAQSILAGPNTVCGGDCYCGRTEGFPTRVCWDPDAQRVWLELDCGAADSIITDGEVAGFAHYQAICEDWGVRHCASRKDYERILSELGAQSYDEFLAAAQEQAMGGMGGMA